MGTAGPAGPAGPACIIGPAGPTFLSELHPHPRDALIEFDEPTHVYTIGGQKGYTSVTTWIHAHFANFDADAMAGRIAAGRRAREDSAYKYFGMSKAAILEGWEANRVAASGAGTAMHRDIELFYNGVDTGNASVEFGFFRRFLAEHPHLRPYRTEWCVFHEELRLAGSIDMVFETPAGDLLIYDWKRVREISYESAFGQYGQPPGLAHMPDTNFWHYSLQLNVYRYLLERKYGKRVAELCLVCLHPDNASGTYDLVPVPFLDEDVAGMVRAREAALASLEPAASA